MNIKPDRGALVYLPIGVRLYKMADGQIPLRYKTISKPTNVLIMDKRDRGYWTVLYEGENWHVPTEDLYPTHFEKIGD